MPRQPSGFWGTWSKPRPDLHEALALMHEQILCLSSGVCGGVGGLSLVSCAGTRQPCTSRQRSLSHLRLSTAFHSGGLWARAYGGGRGPCRARARRGWSKSARGSPPCGPPGQRQFVPILVYVGSGGQRTRLGRTEEALQALAEAHTLVEQQEERWWEAEVCRLPGNLASAAARDTTGGSRGLVATGSGRRPPPAGEITEAARRHEPPLACGRSQGKRAEARELLGPNLRLVHRGV